MDKIEDLIERKEALIDGFLKWKMIKSNSSFIKKQIKHTFFKIVDKKITKKSWKLLKISIQGYIRQILPHVCECHFNKA